MRTFPETPIAWFDQEESERWRDIQRVLAVVTGALEIERREKRIGSALDAAPRVHIADDALLRRFDGVDPAEVFRTSGAELVLGEGPANAFRLAEEPGVAVESLAAPGLKCLRSWKVLPEVRRNLDQQGLQLTDRDVDAVRWWDAQRPDAA